MAFRMSLREMKPCNAPASSSTGRPGRWRSSSTWATWRMGVLGWTLDMPRFLAAADVIVENAGGLTAMEACAAGVAVVSFRPIPGHGRENARAMVRAGVCAAPATLHELVEVVEQLTSDTARRRDQLAAAGAMFAGEPIDPIVQIARTPRPGGA